MITLSINIVYTPGYNELDLSKNRILQNQIIRLTDEGIVVNILVNGKSIHDITESNHWIGQCGKNLHLYEWVKYRMYLGVARNFLTSKTMTDWYIQADEDDWFENVDNVLQLRVALEKITTPLAFYRSNCYSSDGQLIRRIPREEDNEIPSTFRFYYQYAIDNTVAYNTKKTSFLLRPAMNNGVDNIFSYMCAMYFPNASFIALEIYHYNQGDAKMTNEGSKSKIEDDGFYFMDKYLNFNILTVVKLCPGGTLKMSWISD